MPRMIAPTMAFPSFRRQSRPTASLTLSLASPALSSTSLLTSFRLPFARSALPSASRRLLSVSEPAASFTRPLASSLLPPMFAPFTERGHPGRTPAFEPVNVEAEQLAPREWDVAVGGLRHGETVLDPTRGDTMVKRKSGGRDRTEGAVDRIAGKVLEAVSALTGRRSQK